MAFYKQLCAVTRIEWHRVEADSPEEAAAKIAAGESYGHQPEPGTATQFVPWCNPVFMNDSWRVPIKT